MPHFYFRWSDATDLPFNSGYAVDDEDVFSFALKQEETEFARLTVAIRNPRVALLSTSRKSWMWFSVDDGDGPIPLFFGRLIGIPTSIFDDIVTLEFVAEPADYNDQRETLADALRVLPYYDPIFVDVDHRTDIDQVLEAYTKLWHVDRVTHDVTVSDVLIGEDGIEEFQADELRDNGLSVSFDQTPLTSVDVTATLSWTQRAQGDVDLTSYIVSNWPNESPGTSITSFTMQDGDWPKVGAGLGDGWGVSQSSCVPRYDLTVRTRTAGGKKRLTWSGPWKGLLDPQASTTTSDYSSNIQYVLTVPPGSIKLQDILTNQDVQITYVRLSERELALLSVGIGGGRKLSSFSASSSWSGGIIPMHWLNVNLVAGYQAERAREEVVTFTLLADVQPIVTDPGDDASLKVKLNSVPLSDPLDPDSTNPEIPIGDLRRRSYIVTPRGEQTLQHLIARAAAHLVRRSRCVKLEFEVIGADRLTRMANVSLRKNARIFDGRLPNGEALGKITGYSVTMSGEDGNLACKVNMACAVGNGGEVSDVEGDPIYVEDDYIGPDEDWQEYDGRLVAVFDSTVGYEPPLFAPNDDGVDFIGGPVAADVIQEALSVSNPPATQRAALLASPWHETLQPSFEAVQAMVDLRTEKYNEILEAFPTVATFKLKNMKAKFSAPQSIVVSDLKIPEMISLGD